MKKCCVFAISLLFLLPSAFSEEVVISESYLSELIQSSSPDMDRIMSDYLQSKVRLRNILDDYQFSLTGSAQFRHSNERAFNPNSPITQEQRTYSVGINRPTAYGIDLGIGYQGDKSTTNMFTNSTDARLFATVGVDLYKNFLGRLRKSEIKEVSFGEKSSSYLRDINIKGLVLQLRALYWDYVAANESYRVSQTLVKSAEAQVKDVRKKKKAGVAESGDVARFQSQYSERKAQAFQFEAQKKIIEADLKELLPGLKGKKIALDAYDIPKTIKQFYSCLDRISSEKDTPYEFSLLDDVVALQEKQYEAQRKVTGAINRPDLALTSEWGSDGKQRSFNRAHDELFDRGEEFYSVGVTLDVPLETKLTKTEKAQAELDKRRFRSETVKLLSQMDSFHETIVDAVGLLQDVVKNRIENSGYLKSAVGDSRKKYRQARITSQQLIDEEDKFFSNELNLIDIEVQIIKVMFDYFSLFTETPCELNKVEE